MNRARQAFCHRGPAAAGLASGVDLPADVAALLGDHWQIEVNETRDRHVSGGAGAQHVQDLVLLARRR